MQQIYSDPTIAPQEMYSDGLSQISYTITSNRMARETENFTARYLVVREGTHFHLRDRTPGVPDRLFSDPIATSNSASYDFIQSDDEPVDLSWLFSAYRSGELEQPSVASLTGYIQGINALIEKGKFDLLTKLLGSAKLSDMSNETMLAFARSTFPVRERISIWKSFVGAVKGELDSRGKDGSRLLRGLV